ncbi:hypothetical protein HK104_008487 [Borealophlyctis nickersoniae]|nr:hypothetical protein HK104_008487 [Borealophlyctis nickersoniae]
MNIKIAVAFVSVFLASMVSSAPPPLLKLGAMISNTTIGHIQRITAVKLAIEDINNKILYPNLLPSTNLTLDLRIVGNGAVGFMVQTASEAAMQLGMLGRNTTSAGTCNPCPYSQKDDAVVGVVGPIASPACISSGYILGLQYIPQIGISCSDSSLSDKTVFPTFGRIIPNSKIVAAGVARLTNFLGYKKVAILTTGNDYGVAVIQGYRSTATLLGIEVLTIVQVDPLGTNFTADLQSIKKSGARVIVFLSEGTVLTLKVFPQARGMGLLGVVDEVWGRQKYAWLTDDGSLYRQASYGNETLSAFDGIVGLRIKPGLGPSFDTFKTRWASLSNITYPGAGGAPDNYAAYSYDSVMSYAYGLDKTLQDGKDPYNGTVVFQNIISSNFTGASGSVEFTPEGDRKGFYDIINVRNYTLNFLGAWSVSTPSSFVLTEDIKWYGGATIAPTDVVCANYPCSNHGKCDITTGKCVCDPQYQGEECSFQVYSDIMFELPSGFASVGYALGALGLVLCLICAGFIVKYRHVKVFKSASTTFLLILVFGCVTGYIHIITNTIAYAGKNLDALGVLCVANPLLLCFGFVLSFGPLFIKTYRIHKIFNRKTQNKIVIGDGVLLKKFAVLVLGELLILVIHFAVDKPLAQVSQTDDPSGKERHFAHLCVTKSSGWFFSLIAYNLVFLLWGCFLAFQVRKTPADYNESRQIGLTIYSVFTILVIVFPVYFIVEYGTISYLLISLTEFLILTLNLGLTVGIKIARVLGVYLNTESPDHSSAEKSEFPAGAQKTRTGAGMERVIGSSTASA